MHLETFGWDANWRSAFLSTASDDCVAPGRVLSEHKDAYDVMTAGGPVRAALSPRLRRDALTRRDLPTVGDWVVLEQRAASAPTELTAVLPRRSAFVRRSAGAQHTAQVVAANIDVALLVVGLDLDFNVRRIERYLTVTWDSGAVPVIVLNKADVCLDLDARVSAVEAVAVGVSILVVSAATGLGLDGLRDRVQPGKTLCLVGSSGVGKSSLINALASDARQATGEIREGDGRGKHTTTYKSLMQLPGGGLIIDTPGMRELQLFDADGGGLDATFSDVAALSRECRFRDCRHEREPGCAVRAAVANGALPADRLRSYHKLRRELHHAALKEDPVARKAEVARWRRMTSAGRERSKRKT